MTGFRGSLRLRLVVVGVAIVAVVVISLDLFVLASTRARLEETLQVVLATRLETANQLAAEFGVVGLGERMADVGIPGVVVRSDGSVQEAVPVARRFVELPPDIAMALGDDVELASSITDDGTIIEVAASRAGISRTLRTLVLVEGLGSLGVVLLAGVLLHRLAGVILRPIDRVVDVARSRAAGRSDARLPDEDPESELGRMTNAFNEMLDVQEEALRQALTAEQRSRTFLAEAAHQLRTPVAGLRASAEALALTDDEGEREQLAVQIGRSSARAGRLVSRLLRLAELDEGVRTSRTRLDLADLAADEVAAVAARHPDEDLTVQTEGDTWVEVDEHAVREAVANLLDNARRHGRPPVLVSVHGGAQQVVLTLADAGAGVTADEHERVFDRFVSLQGQGSGLGLAIVRSIADSHGGTADWTADGVRIVLPSAAPPDP